MSKKDLVATGVIAGLYGIWFGIILGELKWKPRIDFLNDLKKADILRFYNPETEERYEEGTIVRDPLTGEFKIIND